MIELLVFIFFTLKNRENKYIMKYAIAYIKINKNRI